MRLSAGTFVGVVVPRLQRVDLPVDALEFGLRGANLIVRPAALLGAHRPVAGILGRRESLLLSLACAPQHQCPVRDVPVELVHRVTKVRLVRARQLVAVEEQLLVHDFLEVGFGHLQRRIER